MKPAELREFLMKGAVLCVQLTPMKSNEDIDFEGLKENTRFLIEKSRGKPLVLVPAGSTGEKYTMTDEEWKKVVKTVVDVANGKVPVIPGAPGAGARAAIYKAKYAEDVGADAVMVVLPFYHVPNEEGLYLFYKSILDSINIGLMPYNNPDVSKIYMKPHLLKKLVDTSDNIVAVKENTPYIPTLYEQIKTVGDKIPVMQGRGEWWFAATVFLGVRGYISGYVQFMPEISFELLEAGLKGDFTRVKKILEEKIEPLDNFIAKCNRKYGPTTAILPYPYELEKIVFKKIGLSKV